MVLERRHLALLAGAVTAPVVVATLFGDPRAAPVAGVLGGAVALLVPVLEGLLPPRTMTAVRIYGASVLTPALIVLVVHYPYLVTPGFLAAALPASALAEGMEAHKHRRLVLQGEVVESEPFPFSIGGDQLVYLRLVSEGKHATALYDVSHEQGIPSNGELIRLVGVVQTYGGTKLMFVARHADRLGRAPSAEQREDEHAAGP